MQLLTLVFARLLNLIECRIDLASIQGGLQFTSGPLQLFLSDVGEWFPSFRAWRRERVSGRVRK